MSRSANRHLRTDDRLSNPTSPASAGESAAGFGVVFARSDLAGLLRRLFIDVLDALAVLGIVGTAVMIADSAFGASPDAIRLIGWSTLAAGGFVYLAVLKQSPMRTLGFRLFDVRIVTLRGERPSVFRMTCRLLLWVLGPFNQLVDWLWLGGDPARQTLRDKVAGTLVVRNGAAPVARGRLGVAFYDLFTLNIPFLEVKATEFGSTVREGVAGETQTETLARTSATGRTSSSRFSTAAVAAYTILALLGIGWVGTGNWNTFLAQSPRSVVVNDGDQVLYAGTARRADALELAELLTELGYFGQAMPGYVYLDGSGGSAELSFFVPTEAWSETSVIEYYEALSAAVVERFSIRHLDVSLCTPDWKLSRRLGVDERTQ